MDKPNNQSPPDHPNKYQKWVAWTISNQRCIVFLSIITSLKCHFFGILSPAKQFVPNPYTSNLSPPRSSRVLPHFTPYLFTDALDVCVRRWMWLGSFLRTWFQLGLGNVRMFHITLKYWGYHLQQIFENDVKQIPKIGHSPSPGTVNFTFSPHYFTGLPSDIVVFPVASQLTESWRGLPEGPFPNRRGFTFPGFFWFFSRLRIPKKKIKMNWVWPQGNPLGDILRFAGYDLLWANWWNFTNSRS